MGTTMLMGREGRREGVKEGWGESGQRGPQLDAINERNRKISQQPDLHQRCPVVYASQCKCCSEQNSRLGCQVLHWHL